MCYVCPQNVCIYVYDEEGKNIYKERKKKRKNITDQPAGD